MFSRNRSTCLLLLTFGAVFPLSGQQAEPPSLVANGYAEHILPWSFQMEVRIGDILSGPAAFFRVFPWTVGTDSRGRVYVLDVGEYRVAVFDSAGTHLHDLGGRGGGPGEFLRPVGLAVDADGIVSVADAGKNALVRFDRRGRVMEQIRIGIRVAAVAALGSGILIGEGQTPLDQIKLVFLRDSAATVLAEVDDLFKQVSFPGCGRSVPGRRFFAPTVTWAAAGGTVVFNYAPEYRIVLWRDGRRVAVTTRDVPPITISKQEALESSGVRKGYTIRWPGGGCKVSAHQLLDARGFATTMSPIDRFAVAPDGGVWVQRRSSLNGNPRIDIFRRDGRYLGTVINDIRFPSAFVSADRFAAVEYTTDGVPFVAVYRIDR